MLKSLKIDDETKGGADYDGPITGDLTAVCLVDEV
jgi:hypothetical protein